PLARAYREIAGRLATQLEARPVPLPASPVAAGIAPPAVAGRSATVLVPMGSPPGEGETGGWVPSSSVRGGRGGRR
ncbi:hypothetical protein, partial [Frankia sp. AgKG'84/4]|uniref:hypothetical protein n=1 Tax=Frankia sp. AgKG'84/4 TaxID=573490 RepID=UPI002029F8E4